MTGWKRLALMGLMVCLPIPMLAASGLAVPLPAVVYRVAVGVAERTQAVAVRVPGFEAVVAETKQVARRGTIRFSAEELAAGAKPTRTLTPTGDDRVERTRRAPRTAGRAPQRPTATKGRAARALPARSVTPLQAEAEPAARTVAAPDTPERPRTADPPAHADRAPEKPVPAEGGGGGSNTGPSQAPEPKTSPTREEPRTAAPREEPKNTSGTSPAPLPPPPPPPPPASVPPLPVTGVDPVQDPLTLAPKAELEEIAAELRTIAAARNGDRVAQALEKVESAVARLEKTPPDNQGAIGDIRNAIQKLDDALAEREITLAERTLYVTRLNAVVEQLKVTA
jgi:hypothetical protein